MTEDEIAVMDGGKCILQLRGIRPFFSNKFDITKHLKYKYLSGADSHKFKRCHATRSSLLNQKIMSCAVLSGSRTALLLTPGTGISKPPTAP